jgi:uncharacterized protein YprB with RNaseH-like and TPR domain
VRRAGSQRGALTVRTSDRYDGPPVELRDRLTRLGYFNNRPPATAPAGPPGGPTSTGGAVAVPPRPPDPARPPGQPGRGPPPPPPPRRRPGGGAGGPDVADLIEGSRRLCPAGACFVAETRYPLDHVHGKVALSDLLSASAATFALMTGDARLGQLDPERTVLLDTETTGLAGGTGTLVFLVGLGYFVDGHFRIEQFFLRDPSEERAMLGLLGEVLGRFDAVVTFNGKCFDWPLIETRHAYHRLPLRPSAPLHLDLLFPARRLYRRRVGSCALGALESEALGLEPRVDDVPGWLIPTIYFDYLRARDGQALVPVFGHNRRDILSMLSLAVHMARRVDDPGAVDDATDVYSLGRLFEDAGQVERGIRCYERALAGSSERAEVLARLGGAYKRLREHARAADLWESMIADGAASIFPYVELAKMLEHKRRDYARAAELTRRAAALHGATRQDTTAARHAAERADLDRRLRRLERKLGI